MGADYSFELISIETCAPQFIEQNKLFLGSVIYLFSNRRKLCDVSVMTLFHIFKGAF